MTDRCLRIIRHFRQAEHIVCDAFPHAIEQLQIHAGDYVAVITRGHRYDTDCLRTLLAGTMPRYLGMLGSKRRTIALLHMLAQEGFAQDKLDSIHTPIGLDIGALSVQENRGVHCGAIGADAQARTESPLQITYPDGGDISCGCRGGHCQQSAQKSAAAGV